MTQTCTLPTHLGECMAFVDVIVVEADFAYDERDMFRFSLKHQPQFQGQLI